MRHATATLDTDKHDAMDLPAAPSDEVGQPRTSPMKFTYSSGSRPLDGYTIKRGVGRGGFGEVYYGTSDGGKEVALKLIRRNLEVELRGVRHCLNLKHPHLVALYDIKSDEHDDRWVVMEYVSGESLEDVIERNPNGMPEAEALFWMHGICSGVAYLHDQGIVHRDLKPGNIFIDEGVVKIGDYGLSKFISCSRRSGQTESVGTVHYMAPEIANGRYGKEIDTYALGIILYEMVTGRVPFEGESVGEVLMKHLTAEPELSALGEPYRTIVQRALAKDPALRFNSVHELAAMLPGGSPREPFAMPSSLPPRPASSDASPLPSPQVDMRGAAATVELRSASTQSHREPIWAAVSSGWRKLIDAWSEADIHPLLRAVLIVAAVLTLTGTFWIWAPILFVAFLFYGFYWVFRAVVLQPERGRPAPPGPAAGTFPVPVSNTDGLDVTQVGSPPASSPPRGRRPAQAPRQAASKPSHRQRRHHRRSLKTELTRLVARKPARERLTELTGSMVVAAIVSLVASLVILLLITGSIPAAQYVWLALVGTMGSWLVMIPAKFYEGRVEDHSPKRFTQLVLGMLLGFAAWGLSDAFSLNLPLNQEMNFDDPLVGELMSLNSDTFRSGERVPMPMFIGYFGFLLMALRWWTQAEWTRHTRLSIWAVAVSVAAALLLQMLWWFPQPAGAMVAAVMALAIQLSSPWLSIGQRREIVQQLHAG